MKSMQTLSFSASFLFFLGHRRKDNKETLVDTGECAGQGAMVEQVITGVSDRYTP